MSQEATRKIINVDADGYVFAEVDSTRIYDDGVPQEVIDANEADLFGLGPDVFPDDVFEVTDEQLPPGCDCWNGVLRRLKLKPEIERRGKNRAAASDFDVVQEQPAPIPREAARGS